MKNQKVAFKKEEKDGCGTERTYFIPTTIPDLSIQRVTDRREGFDSGWCVYSGEIEVKVFDDKKQAKAFVIANYNADQNAEGGE